MNDGKYGEENIITFFNSFLYLTNHDHIYPDHIYKKTPILGKTENG